uniref:Mannosyl-oligosaccharide glucosidase n=1 Tax=Globodera pallida TaxID=36090 RepID=A0A183C3I4_GLOPA
MNNGHSIRQRRGYKQQAHSIESKSQHDLLQKSTLPLALVEDLYNQTSWSTYRPHLYFGLKIKHPESPLFGLIWYRQPNGEFSQQLTLRHWCDHGDNTMTWESNATQTHALVFYLALQDQTSQLLPRNLLHRRVTDGVDYIFVDGFSLRSRKILLLNWNYLLKMTRKWKTLKNDSNLLRHLGRVALSSLLGGIGFHNLVIRHFDPQLTLQIFASWLDSMNIDGWMPREMILGLEAQAKVPSEFLVQSPFVANPPMFFFVLEKFLRDSPLFNRHSTPDVVVVGIAKQPPIL